MRAEDKIPDTSGHIKGRWALEYLEASNKSWTSIGHSPQDCLSGDVVEEQRLGQRNDTLVWFAQGSINQEQEIGWMSVMWSWFTSSPVHKALKFTGWTGWGQAQMIGARRSHTVQNETSDALVVVYHRNIWEGRDKEWTRGFKGHVVMLGSRLGKMWMRLWSL